MDGRVEGTRDWFAGHAVAEELWVIFTKLKKNKSLQLSFCLPVCHYFWTHRLSCLNPCRFMKFRWVDVVLAAVRLEATAAFTTAPLPVFVFSVPLASHCLILNSANLKIRCWDITLLTQTLVGTFDLNCCFSSCSKCTYKNSHNTSTNCKWGKNVINGFHANKTFTVVIIVLL